MAKILVIDDDQGMRDMLKDLLTRKGYEVDTAVDGIEGLRRLRKNTGSLVITDLIMPEKEGVETILEIQQDFPEVSVIAMSGGGKIKSDDYLEMVKCIPCVKHTLAKPFDTAMLLDLVKALVGE
jgi:two-component system, chemotaxis family, chemotaxis protein CheY